MGKIAMNSKQQLFFELGKSLGYLQIFCLEEVAGEEKRFCLERSLGDIEAMLAVMKHFYPNWNSFAYKDHYEETFKEMNTLCSFNSGEWKSDQD